MHVQRPASARPACRTTAHGQLRGVPPPYVDGIQSGPGRNVDFPPDSKYALQDPLKDGEEARELGRSLYAFPGSPVAGQEGPRTLNISRFNEQHHKWQRLDTFQTPWGRGGLERAPRKPVPGEPPSWWPEELARRLRDDLAGAVNHIVAEVRADLRAEAAALQRASSQVLEELRTFRAELVPPAAEPEESRPDISAVDLSPFLAALGEVKRDIQVHCNRDADFTEVLQGLRPVKAEVDFTPVLTALREAKPDIESSTLLAEIRESRAQLDFTQVIQEIRRVNTEMDFSGVLKGLQEVATKEIDLTAVLKAIKEREMELDFSQILQELRQVKTEVDSLPVQRTMREAKTEVDRASVLQDIQNVGKAIDFSPVINAIWASRAEPDLSHIVEEVQKVKTEIDFSPVLNGLSAVLTAVGKSSAEAQSHAERCRSHIIEEIRGSNAGLGLSSVVDEVKKLKTALDFTPVFNAIQEILIKRADERSVARLQEEM